MITEEHLNHWIEEINYQLTGILNEVAKEKCGHETIIKLRNEKVVSFEYILEKATTIQGTLRCIVDDMKRD